MSSIWPTRRLTRLFTSCRRCCFIPITTATLGRKTPHYHHLSKNQNRRVHTSASNYEKPSVVPVHHLTFPSPLRPPVDSQSSSVITTSDIQRISEMIVDKELSRYVFPNEQPVVLLDCQQAFDGLTKREKLYAHYLSKASWYGGLIVLVQTSPESPLIFSLLHKLFREQSIDELRELAVGKLDFTEDEFQALLVYTSGIFCNMGNYKGFGDTKFIPNVSQDKFESIVRGSTAFSKDQSEMEQLWKQVAEPIYSLDAGKRQLGIGNKGVTTYFSSNCTLADADFINKFMKEKGIEAYNTRLFKTVHSQPKYEVRLASVMNNDIEVEKELLGTYEFEGATIQVTRGDYDNLMALVVENLEKAKLNAANETETKMLEQYINSFTTGSLTAHKNGSRFWIQDKGPVIEAYIGFIETYRDPAGQRGEFEGFVAMVNKAMSAKFAALVDKAEHFLPEMPWPPSFEKDRFLRPDFTSLDVLTFAGSGIPAGINIPNYDEIRQSEGFKNVSLGNVIPASYKDTKVPFLSSNDQEILNKYRVGAFEVQVGLHELLGHGSGKLFCQNKDGTFNFDQNVIDPLTSCKVDCFYEAGETYDSKFTTIGSAYEECRAECVGLYLSLNNEVLKIFGYENDEAANIIYVNWLSMVWAGLRGLEMYQPEHCQWGQAHSQARFVILQVLLEAGQGLVQIEETVGSDGEPDLLLSLDRSKVVSVGKSAIGSFLQKLQVFKSTGNINSAKNLFTKYSHVASAGDGSGLPFLVYRDIVIARRQPRKMFVQPNTFLKDDDNDDVCLNNYDANHEGLIKSWIERFPADNVDKILEELYNKDKQYY